MATEPKTELHQALSHLNSGFVVLALISAVINVLLLGGSLYMMMVYDSVLPSQSLPTLFGLLGLIVFVYIFQCIFDVLRTQILVDMAASFASRVSPRIRQSIHYMALRGMVPASGDGLTPMRDLDAVRAFMSGPGPSALMDLPWMFFFLIVLSFLHPWLGLTALLGAIFMVGLTMMTERLTRTSSRDVSDFAGSRHVAAEESRRHVELLQAMGMVGRINVRWDFLNKRWLAAQDTLMRRSGLFSSISRGFRIFLQTLVLTVGAILVIDGKVTGGVIFASSILSSRALAPIDQVIGQWKTMSSTLTSWKRLSSVLTTVPSVEETKTLLPRPCAKLTVDGLVVVPPGSQRITVQNVNFTLAAGDALGVIGPSGAGKSSLVRALIGAWPLARGSVRLDGAELTQWPNDVLGDYIGYLPQSVELLSGTVAQNISRFQPVPNNDALIAAAKAAHVHDMIVELPKGYDTSVGMDGSQLSAGQRQRIGLARALFNDPFFVILDEPNSNLDFVGENALDAAIQSVRDRGGITIIVAHRVAAIARVNYVMIMKDGRMDAFGTRDDIMARYFPQGPRVVDKPNSSAT